MGKTNTINRNANMYKDRRVYKHGKPSRVLEPDCVLYLPDLPRTEPSSKSFNRWVISRFRTSSFIDVIIWILILVVTGLMFRSIMRLSVDEIHRTLHSVGIDRIRNADVRLK